MRGREATARASESFKLLQVANERAAEGMGKTARGRMFRMPRVACGVWCKAGVVGVPTSSS